MDELMNEQIDFMSQFTKFEKVLRGSPRVERSDQPARDGNIH